MINLSPKELNTIAKVVGLGVDEREVLGVDPLELLDDDECAEMERKKKDKVAVKEKEKKQAVTRKIGEQTVNLEELKKEQQKKEEKVGGASPEVIQSFAGSWWETRVVRKRYAGSRSRRRGSIVFVHVRFVRPLSKLDGQNARGRTSMRFVVRIAVGLGTSYPFARSFCNDSDSVFRKERRFLI